HSAAFVEADRPRSPGDLARSGRVRVSGLLDDFDTRSGIHYPGEPHQLADDVLHEDLRQNVASGHGVRHKWPGIGAGSPSYSPGCRRLRGTLHGTAPGTIRTACDLHPDARRCRSRLSVRPVVPATVD